MVLQLKRVSKYVAKAIKSKSGYKFPRYNLTGQSSFFFALLCGVRGAGKSNSMLQILDFEKEHLLQNESIVYFISPTRDAKVQDFTDKYEDNMRYYDELNIKTFNEVLDDINDRIREWKEKKYIFDLFEIYLKNENEVNQEELNILIESGILDEDTNIDELIKTFNFHHPPRSTLIIDDSMGSPLISSSNSKQGKEAIKFFIRHRHAYCNVFLLSQHFRGISKPIRSNTNMVLLWASKDRSVLKSIFDEFSPLFKGKMENYEEALQLVESKPHQFLFMFYDEIKFLRLGFDQEITFKDEVSDDDRPEKEITDLGK
jgi:hypothetical protein